MSYLSDKFLCNNYRLNIIAIKKGCLRYRQGKSKSWQNKKDRLDKRKVLINIDTIPEGTRKKYGIPTGAEYIEEQMRLHALEDEKKQVEHKLLLEKLANADFIKLHEAYHMGWTPFYRQYLPIFSKRHEKEQESFAKIAAQNHAFWLEMFFLTGTKYRTFRGRASDGFELFKKMQKDHTFFRNVTQYDTFAAVLRQLRDVIREGKPIEQFITNKKFGRESVHGSFDFQKALSLEILSNQQNYTYVTAIDLINHHCRLEGKRTISLSYVKTLMNKDADFKNLVNANRKGGKRLNDDMLKYTVRKRAAFPANTWMIDGTPLQFFCWNEARWTT